MSLASAAVNKSTFTGFATVMVLLAGVVSYFSLGQLEDPEFTVKNATVITTYAGASAEEVELEVTDRIELAIQEMPQLKQIESISRPGLSIVKVAIKPSYPSSQMPQIWDELRKKVRDVRRQLPPGAGEPSVGDDFGDVYGFLMAVTGDGSTYAEIEDHVDELRKELSLVDGVARVELWGVQQRCVYIDVPQARLASLGITMADIQRTLQQQNVVVDSGGAEFPAERLRIEQTGAFNSPDEIANVVVRGRDILAGVNTDELLRIGDIGKVYAAYAEPPAAIMRYNGEPAIGLAISNVPGANIVKLGEAIDQRLAEMIADLPVGIEAHRISWQSDQVDESIHAFVISLLQAVAIVLVVLALAMGLRVAVVVGLAGLIFTILATFVVMKLWGIDLQRMSLGALVIAMGMMVDNAIVVADGILVRMQQGMDRKKAAIEAATQPSMPLLGATVIAVMAFYPIYASEESAGEYCASLFQVVAISLLLSWVLSVTVAPLMSIWMLSKPKAAVSADQMYGGRSYQLFGAVLRTAIRHRVPVLGSMIGLLVVAGWAFGFIDRSFFPDSARLQMMVDYWAPEGTRIQTVSDDTRAIEDHLLDDERVTAVSTFVGQGPPRFYLPVEPELAYPCYGQFIVNVRDLDGLNALIPELIDWVDRNVPQAQVLVRRYGLGPSETWKVEARISGPSIADKDTLRRLSNEALAIVDDSPLTAARQTNWRQRVKKFRVNYDQERARWSGVARPDIAAAARRGFDGYAVGLYREQDKLYPIYLRHVPQERAAFAGAIETLQVQPGLSTETLPLSQVTQGVEVAWEDEIIWRYNRRRTITVQANPPDGVPASVLLGDVKKKIEAIKLPPGYELEWGGEYESSRDAQASLVPGAIPAVVVMALVIVGLFNAFRPPLIILCVIPFALIGVTVGLLLTGQPFGFLALLGAMSLVGMMVKNAIVLLDQINIEKAAGKSDYQAVIDSAMSRLRPVALAAGTTVLGVIPLLKDVFWVAMAVTIMFGLAFGSVLTMVVLPMLYTMFFRVPAKET